MAEGVEGATGGGEGSAEDTCTSVRKNGPGDVILHDENVVG
jgi:hypothetical protein